MGNLANVPNYLAGQMQILGHDINGCLFWFNTTNCGNSRQQRNMIPTVQFLLGGPLLVNGEIAVDPACCCEPVAPCYFCSTIGSEILVEFAAGGNQAGNATNCANNCDDWSKSTWALHQLTQDELTAFHDAYPSYWDGTGMTLGCAFGLYSGLPCGAAYMIGYFSYAGEGGAIQFNILILYGDDPVFEGTSFVSLALTWAVPALPADCLATLVNSNPPLMYTGEATTICDFSNFAGTTGNVLLHMLP